MRRFLLRTLVPLAALAAACGGNVTVDPDGEGGGGGASGPGSSSSSSSSVGGSGGSGGAPGCGQTTESFLFSVVTWTGEIIDCSSVQPGGSQVFQLQGEMTQLSSTEFQIDSCPPNADCAPTLSILTIESPGFEHYLPTATYVDLTVEIDFPFGCSQTLLVKNLPEWGGLPSPGGDQPTLLFAGSEGSPGAPAGAPFAIEAVPLGCYPDDPGDVCGKPEDYALTFHVLDDPGLPALTMFMGELGVWEVTDSGVPVIWAARNLKSFETGWCDDYWNWAWWVSVNPPPI